MGRGGGSAGGVQVGRGDARADEGVLPFGKLRSVEVQVGLESSDFSLGYNKYL